MSVEIFSESQEGYFPYILDKNWQVAVLNYFDKVDVNAIDRVEVHSNTDEVFILGNGLAVLITAILQGTVIKNLEYTKMEAGVIYNIPKNVWHNVVMEKNSTLLIVENSNTHLNDVTYHYLDTDTQKKIVEDLGEYFGH